MITIGLELDRAGLLRRCEVRGHAGAGPPGGDIVCAAVSALCRTAWAVLSRREGISLRGGPGGGVRPAKRGEFTLETEALDGPGRDFLAAAGAFLLEGLGSVAAEYPENCSITIRRN